MYDKGKILTGLILFLAVLGTPVWYNAASGTTAAPVLEEPKGERCVESREFMRANHMALLQSWREDVVRDAHRLHKSADGAECDKSLTRTCLDCHSKADFCDRCHGYAGVSTPYCWNCHAEPAKAKEGR
jgi:hypothetical protein